MMTQKSAWRSRLLRVRHIVAVLLVTTASMAFLFHILTSGAHAVVVINVTTPLDVIAPDGLCSLREAIIVANTDAPLFGPPLPAGECPHDGSPGMDTVILSVPGPYLLTIAGPGEGNAATGDLDILDDLTLQGNGQIVDGYALDRVFDVISAAMVISGTTVQNGYVWDEFGGGIRNSDGSLALVNSTVYSNTAGTSSGGLGGILGGGLYNSGVLTVSNSIFNLNALVDNLSGASVPGDLYAGGGLYNDGGAVTIKDGSTFTMNLVPHFPTPWLGTATMFRGGAIYNAAGTIVITSSSVITSNYVLERAGISGGACDLGGGGIYNDADGTVEVFASAVGLNGVIDVSGGTSCDFLGGGIFNAGRATINGSRIDGNQSNDNGSGYSGGGGLYNASSGVMTVTRRASLDGNRTGWDGGGIHNAAGGLATLASVAITNSQAEGYGGGIFNAGTMALTDSVIAAGEANLGGGGIENRGTLTVTGDSTAIFGNRTDQGGGLRNADGVANLSQSAFSTNEAQQGGGIWNNSDLVLIDVDLLDNTANGSGGGLYSEGISATATFSASYIARNTATRGGGVFNITGTVSLDPSPIKNNLARDWGGGLYNGGRMTLTRTPVISNSADSSGGGVYNVGLMTLDHAAVTSNTARTDGGGISNAGAVSLTHTTVATNTAFQGGGIVNQIAGSLIISDSLISNNSALDFFGGGIYNFGWRADVIDSEISANRAPGDGGGIANAGKLRLTGVTVFNNMADADHDNNGRGGGLYNEGPTSVVTLTNSSLISNTAQTGGGAANSMGGIMTIEPGWVSRNLAFGSGGGVANDGGRLSMASTMVATNTARHDGGAIVNGNGGSLILVGTSVLNNEAQGLNGGGGIFNFARLAVADSTIAHNWASDTDAGGVWNDGTLVLTNTTVSTNTANARGGGIFNNFGSVMTLTHATVADNRAVLGTGGGLYMKENTTSTLQNSIVANSIDEDCAGLGSPTSAGYNLDSDGTCGLTATGDITNTDPLLGTLDDNGGGTDTHAILPDSPAIDAVPLVACPVNADQRGVARPQWSACDIGAYEDEAPFKTYLPLVQRNE